MLCICLLPLFQGLCSSLHHPPTGGEGLQLRGKAALRVLLVPATGLWTGLLDLEFR